MQSQAGKLFHYMIQQGWSGTCKAWFDLGRITSGALVGCSLLVYVRSCAYDVLSCRTSLHRALYWGHLQAAALLLDAGAQLSIQDDKVRFGFGAPALTTLLVKVSLLWHAKEGSMGQGWTVVGFAGSLHVE